jgi:glycine/D-amino acid oxidase-like deaminating enzyme
MTDRCVVLGSGIVGALTAYRLTERGMRVTLVDAGSAGSGTTATGYGHINASYAGYWDYFALRAAGVAGYRRLRAELGEAQWLADVGCAQFESDETKRVALARHAEPGTADAGLIVTGSPVVQRLRRLIIADGVNIRPCGGGRLMIWSGQIDTEVQESERASGTWCQRPAELAAAAMQAAQLYLPALASAEIETARICRRALPRDGLPVMGWVPGSAACM